jgi:hypothetical protein
MQVRSTVNLASSTGEGQFDRAGMILFCHVSRFAVSFLSATAMIVAIPFVIMKSGYFFTGLALGLAASPLWVWMLMNGLRRYGRTIAWCALLAPIGLFWPLFIVRWIWGSMNGDPHWMML